METSKLILFFVDEIDELKVFALILYLNSCHIFCLTITFLQFITPFRLLHALKDNG